MRLRRLLWCLAAAGVVGLSLSFTDIQSIALAPVALGLVLMTAAFLVWRRFRLPQPGRLGGPIIDGCFIAVLFLAVPNLLIFDPTDPSAALQTSVIHFHQDFLLGPANQVLGGGAMLVDTLSQYGVASIYFLAGVFAFIPIGDGTLGLIEGVLSALMFCGGYVVVRVAGVSRLLAGLAFTVAVVVLIYGLEYPVGGLLQHGAFRFGLPMGVLIGAVCETRWPQRALPARILQLVTVALASVWGSRHSPTRC